MLRVVLVGRDGTGRQLLELLLCLQGPHLPERGRGTEFLDPMILVPDHVGKRREVDG